MIFKDALSLLTLPDTPKLPNSLPYSMFVKLAELKICLLAIITLFLLSPIFQIDAQPKKEYAPQEVSELIDLGLELIHKNIDKADSISNIVYYHSIALQQDSLIAKSHALMAYIAYYKGNYSLSSEYYKKSLAADYYQKKLVKRQALLNNLGVNYEFQHNYAEANHAYLQSLQIARTLGDSLSIYQSYINLGLLNSLLTKYDEAKAYLTPALSYFTRIKDGRNTALCLRNFANLYVLEGNEDECIRYYNLALQEINKIATPADALETDVDFNWALLKFKKYALVRSRQDQIRPLIEKAGTSSGITGTFYLIEGNYYLETKTNLSQAEIAFEKAYQIFKEQKSIRQLTTVQEGRLALYALTGNLPKHRSLLAEYTSMLEDNYLSINANELESIQNIHKLDLQKLEIEKLTSKLAFDKKMNVLMLILLALCLILVGLFARGFSLIKKQKSRIKEKNAELTALVKLLKERFSETRENQTGTGQADKQEIDNRIYSFEKEYNGQVFDKIQQLVTREKLYLRPDLKINDVADALQINEKEVSKAINDIKDQRFTSYINQFRIELAKELLLTQSQLSIKEVAFKSGFSSQPQFQRKFKELTGLTPEQFRQLSSYQDLHP